MNDQRLKRRSDEGESKPSSTSSLGRSITPLKPRLGGRGTFKRILDHKLRAWSGPIGMSIAPVTDPSIKLPRLGISIGRPVGNAVKRNRIKRLLRETFRASRSEWGVAVDVVILVKPHETMPLLMYVEAIENLRPRLLKKLQASATTDIG